MLIVIADPNPPRAATPSRPSGPRDNGMIASAPRSPAIPVRPPASGNAIGLAITPPLANGTGVPCCSTPPLAKGSNPLNKPPRLPEIALCSGANAAFNTICDKLKASDLKTSLKLLPLIARASNALISVPENFFAICSESKIFLSKSRVSASIGITTLPG